jgi:hypothetical protein
MATVTNNHKSPLGLPNGQVLEPRLATKVRDWDVVKQNAVVAAWVRARILSVDAPAPIAVSQPVAEEKDALIAALAKLGIKKGRNCSVETLQNALAEAQKAAADSEGDSPDDLQD